MRNKQGLAMLGVAGIAVVALAGCEPGPLEENTFSSTYNNKTVATAKASTFMHPQDRRGGVVVTYYDPLADGNSVYGQTHGYTRDTYTTVNGPMVYMDLPSIGTASGTFTLLKGLAVNPDHSGYVNWSVNICAQMGWPVPDSCSGGEVQKSW